MLADIETMIWKEWKEYLFQRGSLRGGLLGVVIMLAVFGIFLPAQIGLAWVESPLLLGFYSWVPVFLVIAVIADSFAGERERHTLETLLVTRLSDRAILFGKVLAAILYGWGFAMLSLLLGLVTVNVTNDHGQLVLFSPTTALAIVGLSLLEAGLATNAGVLVSLRAATMRQAQQTLSAAMMILLFPLLFGVQAMPAEWKVRLASALATGGFGWTAFVVAVVLILINAVLVLASMARFQRARLILD